MLLAIRAFAGATLYLIFKVLYGVNRIEIGVPSARFDFVRFLYVQPGWRVLKYLCPKFVYIDVSGSINAKLSKSFWKGVKMQDENKEESFKSGRGGKRAGAGRPKGSVKEIVKKRFTFRLSREEETAVRDLLKKMRNK